MKLIRVKCKDEFNVTEKDIEKETKDQLENYDWDLPLSVDWNKLVKKVVPKVVKELKKESFKDRQDFEDAVYEAIYNMF